jgi:hypothetical protein
MIESPVSRVQRLLGPLPDRRKTPRNGGEVWIEPFTEAEVLNARAILAHYKEQNGQAGQTQSEQPTEGSTH